VVRPSAPRTPTLVADAGDYVAVTGTVDRPGLVLVSASTGCRPVGHRPAADPTTAPPATDRAQVDGALAAFGITAQRWSTHALPCGVRTIEADGARPAGALPAPGPGRATALVRRDDVYAEQPGLLVRADGDRAVVSLTTGGCA
jgi:hypothetical protein